MRLKFEYGKALGRLEEFRRNHQNCPCVRSLTMRHFWREAHVWCAEKVITERHVELILKAWQLWSELRRTYWTCANLHIRYKGKDYEDLTCASKSIRIFRIQLTRARNCDCYKRRKESVDNGY